MTFGKKTLFSLLVGLDLLTNMLVLTNVNYLGIATLLALCTYTFLPGFLLSLILRIRRISFWENFLFIVGLGILFLELGGLTLNIILPIFGINDPLAAQNIVIGFNTFILLLFVVAWTRTRELVIKLPGQAQHAAGSGSTKHTSLHQPGQFGPYEALVEADTIAMPRQVSNHGLINTNHGSFEEMETMALPRQVSNHGLINSAAIEEAETMALPRQVSRAGLINTNEAALEESETIAFIPVQSHKHSSIEKILYVLPPLFPILATLGAIVLNNGGSNMLTLILLGGIAFYTLLLVLTHRKITDNLYPYSIFFIALALLLTTSLRSWYITGHDIEREFYVFELTNAHHFWNMAYLPQDAYMACLSITMLPTVLVNLLPIQDMYIYKVIFQILFATSPVVVFFIIRNYTTPILAYLSAFFYMSFPTFFNDMAMLNRQEIGFIFFGLALYMMLMPTLTLPMRRVLFLIFGLGVIISHYSTNFVLLALVMFVYGTTLVLSRRFVQNILLWLSAKTHIRPKSAFPNKVFLRSSVVLILFLMTFLWNDIYTNSSNHAGSVLVEVVNGIFVKSNDASSGDVSYSIFTPHPKLSPEQEIQSYIQDAKANDNPTNNSPNSTGKSDNTDASPYYSKAITSKYPTQPIPQEELAPTPLGNWLTSLHVSVFDVQAELRALSADFMQVFVFIGLLVIFFSKSKKPIDLQYLLFCFGAIFLLVLEIVVPELSVEYGLLRMFQQFLFLLSLPIVLGLSSVLFFVKEQKRILFTAVIAAIFFLNLTGFIAHLTGDYYPQLILDNAGLYYDAYYVHKSDVQAMVWLSKNNVNNAPVDADLSGTSKLLSYANINALDEMYPDLIRKDAYVFQEASSHTVVVLQSDILIINSAQPFLDANKNLIYSNGSDHVYK